MMHTCVHGCPRPCVSCLANTGIAGDCRAGRDYSVCPTGAFGDLSLYSFRQMRYSVLFSGWHDVGGLFFMPSTWVSLLATVGHTPCARRRLLRENASFANKRRQARGVRKESRHVCANCRAACECPRCGSLYKFDEIPVSMKQSMSTQFARTREGQCHVLCAVRLGIRCNLRSGVALRRRMCGGLQVDFHNATLLARGFSRSVLCFAARHALT